MYPTLKFKTAIIIGLLSMCASSTVLAQLSNYKAYTLFVYNFTKYIQWPEGSIKDNFVIGVYGESPVKEELVKMIGLKKVGDKNIKIVEIKSGDETADLQILFIPEAQSAQIANILNAVKGKPILLVGERQGLIQKGAGISFYSDQNNLKFELNNTSITSQNLKVSNTLLALAYKGS
jgi:hypothetical protein